MRVGGVRGRVGSEGVIMEGVEPHVTEAVGEAVGLRVAVVEVEKGGQISQQVAAAPHGAAACLGRCPRLHGGGFRSPADRC